MSEPGQPTPAPAPENRYSLPPSPIALAHGENAARENRSRPGLGLLIFAIALMVWDFIFSRIQSSLGDFAWLLFGPSFDLYIAHTITMIVLMLIIAALAIKASKKPNARLFIAGIAFGIAALSIYFDTVILVLTLFFSPVR